uniref:Uncharacterized protein n=1 Tax=viral metagenome TaxID=1070528 RepID=A0A6C0JW24_9ZZZZ
MTQSIFDILNLSNIFWKGEAKSSPPPDPLDTTKRHYLCVENGDRTSCNRIYTKPIASGTHVTISAKCPKMFDGLTLSYKLGKAVYKN